jgi:hypothetical protein
MVACFGHSQADVLTIIANGYHCIQPPKNSGSSQLSELLPHHGSKTSSSAGFLDAVQPGFAMVQAGCRNRFGHPASSVLVRYDVRQIAVVDTPHYGASLWQSWRPDQVAFERDMQCHNRHHDAPRVLGPKLAINLVGVDDHAEI